MAATANKTDDKVKGDKDTTSNAQGRFVVSLPAEVGELIDRVGTRLSEALTKETGIGFELSRAQIVQALVRQALKDQDSNNGDGNGDGSDGNGDGNGE